jgi:hypothetical protein
MSRTPLSILDAEESGQAKPSRRNRKGIYG